MKTMRYMHRVSGMALSFALMAVTMCGVCSCSSDDDELVMNEKGEYRVRISMGLQQTADVITRTAGYHASSQDDFGTSATLVLKCKKKENGVVVEEIDKTSTWDGTMWSDIYLLAGIYDIYAVIPGSGTATLVGEIWTISGVPVVSQKDVLAAQKVENFVVHEVKIDGPNTLTLDCDHLTCKLTPELKINSKYSDIRLLYVSQITVSSDDTQKYDATITYEGTKPKFTWGAGAAGSKSEAIIFNMASSGQVDIRGTVPDEDKRAGKQVTTDYEPFRNNGGYLVPLNGKYEVDMKIRYDVYSTNGTLARQSSSATNKINLNELCRGNITAGNNYILQIEIIPSYLYSLSDDDLMSQFPIQDNVN